MLNRFFRSALALTTLLVVLCLPLSPLKADPVNVLTYHNDNARTGANTSETILTPQNVNSTNFGRLFSHAVDGQVVAQPLYVANVNVPGKGVHNLLIVATEHDGVYAFDADDSAGSNSAPLWQRSFVNPANGVTSVPNGDTGTGDIQVEIGITGTPVIGLGSPDGNGNATGTLYLVTKTKEIVGGVAHYVQRLHALDVTTGLDLAASPVLIGDTTTENNPPAGTATGGGYSYYSGPYVAGTGDGSVTVNGQNRVYFNALREAQRPGLVLVGSRLYVSYASHGDNGPYHGWVLGYDANTLALGAFYNTSPNGGLTGIWMSGEAPAVDAAGNLFFITGNGGFDANNTDTSTTDYGDSFLRLGPLLTFANPSASHSKDFFSPSNQANLNQYDTDVGSGGLTLLPDSVGSTAHPHLLVGCGKQGKVYLLDRDSLGGFNAGGNADVQEWNSEGTWSSPAYWNGAIYYQGAGGALKRFPIANGVVDTNNVIQSGDGSGFPGSTPTISANGTTNGIVWTIQSDAYGSNGQAVLHAHDALNPATELYNSTQIAARDNPGISCKFTLPIVTNGKVYVGTQNQISAYGLNPPALCAAPVITSNGQGYVGDRVTITDTTQTASIYYTTDGTDPTPSSTPYVAPFVVSGCETIKAKAFATGYLDSAVTSRFFGMQGTAGHGTGLVVTYFTDNPNTRDYLDPANGPTVSRIDPVIDFSNWTPDPSIGAYNFSARWTGQVQPEFTDTYTFTTASDDGIRVFVNGQEIINNWTDHGETYNSGTIALQGGQRYDVKVEFYQGGGGSEAHLYWSSACQASQIVPSTQLYPGAPDVPTGLTATAGDTEVALAWTPSPGASSYVVKRGTTKGGPYAALTPAPTGPSFTDTGVVNGTTYYYVVDAVNSFGTSGDSGQASATPTAATTPPAAPTGLTAQSSASQITLTWTGTLAASTYNVYRGTAPNGENATALATGVTAQTYADAAVTSGVTYYYQVTGVNYIGEGARSNEAGAIAGLAAIVVSPSSVTLGANGTKSFTAVANGGNGQPLSPQPTIAWSVDAGGVGSVDSNGNYTAGTTSGTATVRATASGVSGTAGVTVATPPAAPTGLSATTISSSEIDLAWTNTDNTQTSLKLERSTDGGATFVLYQTLVANATTYQDKGLTSNTTYVYRIKASNANGDSAPSATATATTNDVPPAQASNLTVTAVTTTEIDLTFQDNASNETGFHLYRKTGTGGTFSLVATLPASPGVGATVPYADKNLTPGTYYEYHLKAFNAVGEAADFTGTHATTVSVPATTLTVANETGAYGQTVSLNATLQVGGNGLTGKTLTYQIDGSTIGTAVTNGSGVASLSYVITGALSSGPPHTITVTYAGDGSYGASSGTGTLTVTRSNTALSVASLPGAYGQTVTLTATLTRTTDGAALSGRTVGFAVGGVQAGTAITSAAGVATLTYVVPNGLTLGAHPVAASFADNGGYLACSGTGTLTVAKAGTSLTVPAASGARGATVTLRATLQRATDGALMANRSVTFTVDGKAAGMAVTNASGVASRSYTAPAGSAAGGHPVSAGYAGDGTTLAGTGTGTLTVNAN